MSPIRPENVGHYPSDWPAISWVIRWIRALGRCECRGQCGVPHNAPYGRCGALNHTASAVTGARVVLTVAHLDHVPQQCHPANLRAFCQSCHLRYDRDHHAATRRRTSAATRGKPMSFTCPACGRTSRHPGDHREGYCARCHQWTRDSNGPYVFGRWDLAVVDAGTLVAAPLGEPCASCNEPIGVDDQGYLRPVPGTAAGIAGIRAFHAGCEAVHIVGHDHGVCHCTGWDTNTKAAGDELWRRLHDSGF